MEFLGTNKIIAFVIRKCPNGANFHQKTFGATPKKIHLLVVVAKGSLGQLGKGSGKK